MHSFASIIKQGIFPKALEAQTCPIQSAWFRTLLLPQQHKKGSQHPSYATWCEQSKISHPVPANIRQVLRQDM
jgi:hypothetical protein